MKLIAVRPHIKLFCTDARSQLKVKIADMTDNLDISRISRSTDRDRERIRMYEKNIIGFDCIKKWFMDFF